MSPPSSIRTHADLCAFLETHGIRADHVRDMPADRLARMLLRVVEDSGEEALVLDALAFIEREGVSGKLVPRTAR